MIKNDIDFSIENFKDKIRDLSGKILAIDFGTKKMGLAMTNIDRSMAFPYEIYQRKSLSVDIEHFLKLINEHKICGIVFGVPLIDDMHIGNRRLFNLIKEFISKINEGRDIPYLFYNEEFSSHISNEYLYDMGFNKGQILRQEDKMVAVNFLKEVFDMG